MMNVLVEIFVKCSLEGSLCYDSVIYGLSSVCSVIEIKSGRDRCQALPDIPPN